MLYSDRVFSDYHLYEAAPAAYVVRRRHWQVMDKQVRMTLTQEPATLHLPNLCDAKSDAPARIACRRNFRRPVSTRAYRWSNNRLLSNESCLCWLPTGSAREPTGLQNDFRRVRQSQTVGPRFFIMKGMHATNLFSLKLLFIRSTSAASPSLTYM